MKYLRQIYPFLFVNLLRDIYLNVQSKLISSLYAKMSVKVKRSWVSLILYNISRAPSIKIRSFSHYLDFKSESSEPRKSKIRGVLDEMP